MSFHDSEIVESEIVETVAISTPTISMADQTVNDL
jgi:hypothetical protein